LVFLNIIGQRVAANRTFQYESTKIRFWQNASANLTRKLQWNHTLEILPVPGSDVRLQSNCKPPIRTI